jgi:hypothetical protein
VWRIDEFGRMQRCVIGFLLGDYALQGVTEWEISEEDVCRFGGRWRRVERAWSSVEGGRRRVVTRCVSL